MLQTLQTANGQIAGRERRKTERNVMFARIEIYDGAFHNNSQIGVHSYGARAASRDFA